MIVEVRIVDRIGFIEMQNPDHYNVLSDQMCTEMVAAIKNIYKKECVAIVIEAQTKRGVWSAGHDINELPQDGNDPLAYDVPMEELLRTVQEVPIPVIACVTGTVWGGACDLCISCDMLVASETSTFAITPAKIGIPYNASGIMHFINQLGMNKAREMFFTAMPLTAHEALNVGFVNQIAPVDMLHKLLEVKFLNPLRRNSVLSVSAIKRQFRTLTRASHSINAESFERINAYRKKVYQGPDYKEGINSFLEKRDPQYSGKASDLDDEFSDND